MKKKVSFIIKYILAISFLLVVPCMAFSYQAMAENGGQNPILLGGELAESYWLGAELEIPTATITNGDENVEARAIVYQPSGDTVIASSLSLTEAGIYTVVYMAEIEGKTYSFDKEFIVNTPLYSVQSKKSSVCYGVDETAYETDMKGIYVSLVQNDVFSYNDVIDLNQAEGNFLELAMMPMDGAGTKDLRKLIITLTDIYDADKKLTIIAQCSNRPDDGALWYLDNTYLLAGGENQAPTGYEVGQGRLHVDNAWGCAVTYSFYGMHGQNVAVGKETLRLAYDKETKIVSANGATIIDLDNLDYFDEAWEGFTTGEVKMSIMGDEYSRVFANFMITKVGGQDLSREMAKDDVAPDITVDLGDYDQVALPNATVGYSYPVFSATAYDKISGVADVQTKVYFNYTSSQRYALNIQDGKFIPQRTGVYTIEYSATDYFGNTKIKTIDVQCGENATPLLVKGVGDYATNGLTGNWLEIADMEAVGGVGKVEMYATIEKEDVDPMIVDSGFRAETAGVYTVTLHAVDMIGQHATASYEISVASNGEPIFLDEVLLPKYLLSGYSYQLPTLYAYDFSDGKQEIETSITIVDGNGTKDLTRNVCTFIPDSEGLATIIYKAEGKAGSSDKSYQIPVIYAKENDAVRLDRYFQGENVTSVANKNNITVSATQNVEYTFISELVADGFSVKFAIAENNFSTLQLVFTDSKDDNVRFTIEIEKSADAEQNALLKINGVATKYRPYAGFYDGNDFILTYDNMKARLTDDHSLEASIKNADGTVFQGFPSGKMYMSVKMLGVEGNASVAWKNLNKQVLSNVKTDAIKPMVSVLGEYHSNYKYGTTAEIYPAAVADVISPEVYSSVSVRTPDGEYVTDVNGKLLKNVALDETYHISLEQYGSYSVVYTATDANGKEQPYYYSIIVVDDIKPIIKLTKDNVTTAKVGQNIGIAKAVAMDNVDGEVKVYAYVKDSEGYIHRVENGGNFCVGKVGVYEIHYMAFDAYGNLTIDVYQVAVA